MSTIVKFAALDQGQLDRLHNLERELGRVIVAFEPAVKLASLSEDEVRQLQATEQELGVVLVAYDQR